MPTIRSAVRFIRARRWTHRDAVRLAKKAVDVWRRDGLTRVLQLIRGEGRAGISAASYTEWIAEHDTLSEADREQIAARTAAMSAPPLISVLMPTYNTPPAYLRRAIDSVMEQVYPHWELCIADDASTDPATREVLASYDDPRITIVWRPKNGHISHASNSALERTTGSFVALLDHDDELAPHALYVIAEAIRATPEAALIYSDEDKIDARGKRFDPYFKPDWNPDLFRSQNFVSHLGVYRRDLMQELGGFRAGLEGSQDYDLALRVTECMRPDQIVHVPHVLYHWRSIPGSTALDGGQKSYALTAASRALHDHLKRTGVDATTETTSGGYHRIRYGGDKPRVTIIIPTKDRVDLLKRALDSIVAKTDYAHCDIIVVDNRSELPETHAYLRSIGQIARVLTYDQPFNYSAINNYAVSQCATPLVALLNNDIEIISPNWLSEMVAHAVRPDIGCVGAMLYYPDDRIQHAGVVLGMTGVAGHIHRLLVRGSPGYFARAALTQNFSVVTAACLVTRRSVYDEVGGLDEQLQVAYNDVDFCLRVQAKGYRNVWTPYAELYHHESASRGLDTEARHRDRFAAESDFMRARWGALLDNDPAYSPNLSLASVHCELAATPRAMKPWSTQ